jgi:hypothetical protein
MRYVVVKWWAIMGALTIAALGMALLADELTMRWYIFFYTAGAWTGAFITHGLR